jgi:hypothetical protein
MVNKALNSGLLKIVQDNMDINQVNDSYKFKKLETKINSLKENKNVTSIEINNLLAEARTYTQLAQIAENLADQIEKNKKEKKKKEMEEIINIYFEKLDIPPAFIEQLSILSKGGANALREGALLYREEGRKRHEQADQKRDNLEFLEKEISNLEKIHIQIKNNSLDQNSFTERMQSIQYRIALREKGEMELKRALEELEGRNN